MLFYGDGISGAFSKSREVASIVTVTQTLHTDISIDVFEWDSAWTDGEQSESSWLGEGKDRSYDRGIRKLLMRSRAI